MADTIARVELSYEGGLSAENQIDFYDISQALVGFQRTIALTTHLILNDQIITQAPSLKNAQIVAIPPEPGSWKAIALVMTIGTGIYNAGTAPKDTVLGHLVWSAYDYVISETLGFHVDYEKTLGQQYEALQNQNSDLPVLQENRFDSLAEKCERSIREMHRPIVVTNSASYATIGGVFGETRKRIAGRINQRSFEYISETYTPEKPEDFVGRVTSYNSNTYKGRAYIRQIGRPIPFELREDARTQKVTEVILLSLASNARYKSDYNIDQGFFVFKGYRNQSKSGFVKSLTIFSIE